MTLCLQLISLYRLWNPSITSELPSLMEVLQELRRDAKVLFFHLSVCPPARITYAKKNLLRKKIEWPILPLSVSPPKFSYCGTISMHQNYSEIKTLREETSLRNSNYLCPMVQEKNINIEFM